ncbi:MAG: hypothetical protein WA926_08595, partial [Methylovirgula sp.]
AEGAGAPAGEKARSAVRECRQGSSDAFLRLVGKIATFGWLAFFDRRCSQEALHRALHGLQFGAVAFRHLAATASKIARAARTRMVSKVEIGDVLRSDTVNHDPRIADAGPRAGTPRSCVSSIASTQ